MTSSFVQTFGRTGLTRPAYAAANFIIGAGWVALAALTGAAGSGAFLLVSLGAAGLAWLTVSWRRAADARLRWLLTAPMFTASAVAIFLIFGGWGDYASANRQAPTPAYIWAVGAVFWMFLPAWPLATLSLCIAPRRS